MQIIQQVIHALSKSYTKSAIQKVIQTAKVVIHQFSHTLSKSYQFSHAPSQPYIKAVIHQFSHTLSQSYTK
ncbi:hypothetical protein DPMN_181662 [Dreissena polymorpha]|uniref:Uncharacterized protein n=1 Tax=Dreissena polymorpha TaxID=45954 RepID=A0A9D4DDA6_DREPO|nr:hypothetical protein DPMN_181662 [Dreissena polymorpha]